VLFSGLFKNGQLHSTFAPEIDPSSYATSSNSAYSTASRKVISFSGFTYDGEVDARSCPSGQGCLVFPQGDRYDGEFMNGRRCGRGKYTFSNGDVYEGLWKNDVREGRGILRYANGDVYEGMWSNDVRCGLGSLLFSDGSRFVGDWVDDSFCQS
jgi:hypothetical protein